MSIQVGDLVILKSLKSGPIKGDKHGIVIKVTQSSVFEGGEDCQILEVLRHDSNRKVEVMSWGVSKVNQWLCHSTQ